MARAKKATRKTTAKRATTKRTGTKRASTRRASSARSRGKRVAPRRAGLMSTGGMFDFVPSGWFKDLMSSQTSRVIMAEALVAAAGAAAAVLVASRTETGERAGKALADSGALMKEAAVSAAAAARDVIGKGATEAIGSAARSLMGAAEETQHELAEKALRLKREHEGDVTHQDIGEHTRRQRHRPH